MQPISSSNNRAHITSSVELAGTDDKTSRLALTLFQQKAEQSGDPHSYEPTEPQMLAHFIDPEALPKHLEWVKRAQICYQHNNGQMTFIYRYKKNGVAKLHAARLDTQNHIPSLTQLDRDVVFLPSKKSLKELLEDTHDVSQFDELTRSCCARAHGIFQELQEQGTVYQPHFKLLAVSTDGELEQGLLFLETAHPGSGGTKASQLGWFIKLVRYPDLGWGVVAADAAILQQPLGTNHNFELEAALLEQLSKASITPQVFVKATSQAAQPPILVSQRVSKDGFDVCEPELCALNGRYSAARQLCQKVALLHSGTFVHGDTERVSWGARHHGDIKPQNFVCHLVQDGQHSGLMPTTLYLIDFDCSLSLDTWTEMEGHILKSVEILEHHVLKDSDRQLLLETLQAFKPAVVGSATFASPEKIELYGLVKEGIAQLQVHAPVDELVNKLRKILDLMQHGDALFTSDAYGLGVTLLWLIDFDAAYDVGLSFVDTEESRRQGRTVMKSVDKEAVHASWINLLGDLQQQSPTATEEPEMQRLLQAAEALLKTAPEHRATAQKAYEILSA